MAAHGNAIGQAGDLDAEGLEQPGDVQRRSLALGVRVGGHDDLSDAALGHAVQQGSDVQIIGPHVVHGGQHAVKHMVTAAVFPTALDGDHVPGIGHHADGGIVALLVGADGAQAAGGQVLTHGAEGHVALGVHDGVGKGPGLLLRQGQHIEGQSLGGFIAYARQAGELLH